MTVALTVLDRMLAFLIVELMAVLAFAVEFSNDVLAMVLRPVMMLKLALESSTVLWVISVVSMRDRLMVLCDMFEKKTDALSTWVWFCVESMTVEL